MEIRDRLIVCVCLAVFVVACEKSGDKKSADAEAPTEEKKSSAKSKESGDRDEESSGGGSAAEITAEADLPEPTKVEGGDCEEPKKLTGLKGHTVLTAGSGGCYFVDEVLRLKGDDKRLTVEPGVTVKFGEDAGIVIRKAGLEVEGTSDKPVVFTGMREVPGFWKGILVRESDKPANTLRHARIEYGGKDSTFDGVRPAGLMFDDYHGKSSFTVRDTTITHAEGYGLYAETAIDLEFADNELTANKKGVARIDPANIGDLDSSTTYEGNEQDRVFVEGGKLKGHEATWPGIGVPYVVESNVRLKKDSAITVQSGATFKFAENTGFAVRESRLEATGTSDAPIRFTGKRDVRGFWRGLVVRESDSVDNLLEHVTISYAGADNTFDGVEPAAVMFDDYHGGIGFEVTNSTFSHSGGYGVYAEQGTDLTFGNNDVTKNRKGAVRAHPAVVGALDGASTYSGNEKDRVHVKGAKMKGVEATWPAIDVPYVLEGTVRVRKDSFLTLSPGVTVTFAEQTGLVVRRSKLKAEGTAEEPIRFAGMRETAGFWRGIVFRQSTSIDNILRHVTIAHAGSSPNFDGVKPAALMLDDYHGPVEVSVGHLAVEASGGAGLHIEDETKLKSEDCSTVTVDGNPEVSEKSLPLEKACGS